MIGHFKIMTVLIAAIAAWTAGCSGSVATSCADPSSPDCQLLKEASGAAPAVETTSSTSSEDGVLDKLPTGVSNATIFNVNLSGQGIRGYRFKVGPAETMDCNKEDDYSKPTLVTQNMKLDVTEFPDGTMAVCLMTMDKDGNWTAIKDIIPATWEKDTMAPVGGMTGMPSGTNNSTALDVAVGGTGGVHDYAFKIGPASTTNCSSKSGYGEKTPVNQPISYDFSALADGDLKLCVMTWDEAGNQDDGSIVSSTWTKDTTAATASLTGAPGAYSNLTSLSVTVAGTDVVGYMYKFGLAQSTSCASGYATTATPVTTPITESIGSLADGNYRLCVVAVDATGNVQSSPTVVNWMKDTVAPSSSATGAPSGTNNATTLNVTVDSSTVVYYKYKVGLSASTDCSDTAGYSGAILASMPITDDLSSVADGAMRLCVIGKDSAGNWQPEGSAFSATWTKVTTAPSGATLTGVPSGDSPVSSVTLGVTSANGVTAYKYKFGAGSSSICASSSGYSASAISVGTSSSIDVSGADGQYTICVIARDTAGNWISYASATTASWTKDTVAPSAVSFSGGPTGTSNSTSITLSVPASGGIAGYRYKAVSGTDCSSSSGYSSEVAAGTNATVDVSGIADGIVTLCVIAKDDAGNWITAANASTSSWTKDTTPPTATISGAPTGTSSSTTLAVTVGGTGVTHYKFKVGLTSSTNCSSSSGYSSETAVATQITSSVASLADGSLTLCLVGRDATGNWQADASATSASWTKSIPTGPVATISGQPTGTSAITDLYVTVGGTGITHYKYKVGATSSTSCSSSSGYGSQTVVSTPIVSKLSSATIGINLTLCVIGTDGSTWQPQSSATTASWDRIAPNVWPATLTGAPSGTSSATSLNVTVGGTNVVSYKFKVGASAATDCSDYASYGSETVIATPITASVSSIAVGATAKLCVIGSDGSSWQLESEATYVTWTRTCSAGYYPVSGTCTVVGTGYYSTDGLNRQSCTNLPSNASYTSTNSITSDCAWQCNTNYLLNSGGTGCDYRPNTQSVSCSTGQAVVGAYGRSGGWMDKLGVRCRSYSSGAFSGNISDGTGYGGSGGSAFTFDCPSGSYLYRITGGNGTTVSSPGSTYLANIKFYCRNLTNGTVTSTSGQYGSSAGVTAFDYTCSGSKPISSIPFDSAGAYVGNVLQAYCGSDLDTSSIVVTPPSPSSTNLVAHWHFDNNLEDQTANYPGTAQGGMTFTPYIKRYGTHGLELNGTDAYVSTNLDLGSRSAFTATGLVYLKQSGSRVGFFGQNDLVEMGLGSGTNTGKACLWVNGSSEICSSSAFALNTWVHVALVSQSGTGGFTRLYVDGILVGTNSALSSTSNSYRFNIGHGVWDPASYTTTPYFKGYIDEIAVWDRALSATEVSALVSGGSVTLNGSSQYLSVAGSSDFAIGTGDFTIEWMQKMQPGSQFARVFSIGTYPSATIAVSIENGNTLYFWANSGYRLSASVSNLDLWNHFAITRSGGTLRAFQNGTQIGSDVSYTTSISNSSTALYIGSEGTSNTYLNGQITNFHWVTGSAKYTANFSKPTSPFTAITGSKLLLRFLDSASPFQDYSGAGKTVTNVNTAIFSSESPF